jgi:HupE / UreJ protein
MRKRLVCTVIVVLLAVACGDDLYAHGVSGRDALFLQLLHGAAIGPLMYLGAKHMVTGYDHLAFLLGVIFFLYRVKDILLYVSLFTLGHSLTLLVGVLGGVRANPYLIDAVIGLSVVYKAFDNIDGFRSLLGVRPDARIAVLMFGLFHGFGLATKLQDFALSSNGLIANIVSFNVGVEIGQAIALAGALLVLSYWRTSRTFYRYAFVTNGVLMAGGFLLVGHQLAGYFLAA